MERQPGEEQLRWVEEQGSVVRVPQWGRAAGEPVPLFVGSVWPGSQALRRRAAACVDSFFS